MEQKFPGMFGKVGDDYILKTNNREAIIKNLKLSKALHEQGFASSLPVPTKKGGEYLEDKEVLFLRED